MDAKEVKDFMQRQSTSTAAATATAAVAEAATEPEAEAEAATRKAATKRTKESQGTRREGRTAVLSWLVKSDT